MKWPLTVLLMFVVSPFSGCGRSPTPRGPAPFRPGMPVAAPLPNGILVPPVGPRDQEFTLLDNRLNELSVRECIQLLDEHPQMHTYRHSVFGPLLISCVAHSRLPLVEYLLEHGADPNVPNLYGENAMFFCIESAGRLKPEVDGAMPGDHEAIMDLLLQAGGRPNSTTSLVGTRLLTSRDEIKSTDSLLEAGVKLQSCPQEQNKHRNAVLARLRSSLDLPVDALLPLNANSLYLDVNPRYRN